LLRCWSRLEIVPELAQGVALLHGQDARFGALLPLRPGLRFASQMLDLSAGSLGTSAATRIGGLEALRERQTLGPHGE
jgi:hypothetical protein